MIFINIFFQKYCPKWIKFIYKIPNSISVILEITFLRNISTTALNKFSFIKLMKFISLVIWDEKVALSLVLCIFCFHKQNEKRHCYFLTGAIAKSFSCSLAKYIICSIGTVAINGSNEQCNYLTNLKCNMILISKIL